MTWTEQEMDEARKATSAVESVCIDIGRGCSSSSNSVAKGAKCVAYTQNNRVLY